MFLNMGIGGIKDFHKSDGINVYIPHAHYLYTGNNIVGKWLTILNSSNNTAIAVSV